MNIQLNINKDDLVFIQNLNYEKVDKKTILIFKKYYEEITNEKEKIDKLENSNEWDKIKKIGNPFELIYTTYNKKKKKDSISNYQPISRSYFKMLEIYYNYSNKIFEHFNIQDNMVFAHLAEGPGGFMEATYNFRNIQLKAKNKYCRDTFYGITLKPNNEFVPDWNKMRKLFSDINQFKIEYGNLYIQNDVKNFIKNFQKNKASIVTADGGFDYSADFNGQEINSCQIIFSECYLALNILKKHGTFVCKIFDVFTSPMIKILYLMCTLFEEVYLYKPETSRPANSEKYLVCINYKDTLSTEDKDYLLNLIKIYQDAVINKTLFDNETFDLNGLKIPNSFVHLLINYNKDYIENQKFYLQKTIKLAYEKPSNEDYDKLIKDQIKNAVNWCKKYNVPINHQSSFF
jgi:23S rRNA U2552 (ribose-2'-O)-methylase RlmE/FtsJ